MVLLAPALAHVEPPVEGPQSFAARLPTAVLHGTQDGVCPVGASRAFAAAHPGLVSLTETEDDHPLRASYAEMTVLVRGASDRHGAQR